MGWTRLGLIYCPDGSKAWSRSHAAQPTPVSLGDDLFRIFFSTRDADQRSHVGWIDVDLSAAPKLVGLAEAPVLAPGRPGSFDDSGVSIGSAVVTDNEIRIYYMGWNLAVSSPWRNAIGFMHAPSFAGPFLRYSEGPVMDRSPEDPFTMTYPCVFRLGPNDWHMWYGSSETWGETVEGTTHVIKHARSIDGIRWERDGRPVVGVAAAGEYFLVRPTVAFHGKAQLMLFACRGVKYAIGAAASVEGGLWNRCDARFGLPPGKDSWEDQETCYPALFWHRSRLWLAYNGNQFGKTGFGLAMWDGEIIL